MLSSIIAILWVVSGVHYYPASDTYKCLYHPLLINGKRTLFLVDTGSPTSCCDREFGTKEGFWNSNSTDKDVLINATDAGRYIGIIMHPFERGVLASMTVGVKNELVMGIIGADMLRQNKMIVSIYDKCLYNSTGFWIMRDRRNYINNTTIEDEYGRLFISIIINGGKYCMLIDTGCTTTVVHSSYATLGTIIPGSDQYFNNPGKNKPTVSCKCVYRNVLIDDGSPSDQTWTSADISRFAFVGQKIRGVECIGLLGNDMIAKYRIYVDLERRQAFHRR